MKHYDAAKRKRNEDTAPKRTWVKYDEAIGKITKNKTWIQWTELKPGETLKYRSREYRKDIPDDQEKLMTRIVNRKEGYDKEKEKKDIHDEKNAASTLMNILSKKRWEQSNNEEAWNQIDDDNNCEAVAKTANNNNEHDRNCVVEAYTGEKKG